MNGSEDKLFESIDFREATDYIVLDAGEYPIEVRPGGEDVTMALESDATFEEGSPMIWSPWVVPTPRR